MLNSSLCKNNIWQSNSPQILKNKWASNSDFETFTEAYGFEMPSPGIVKLR